MYETKRGDDTFYCDIHPKQTYNCIQGDQDECGYDIFDVGMILKAGEQNDDISLIPTFSPLDKPIRKGTKDPQRYTGMTIELKVYYTNNANDTLFSTPWHYEYEVDIIAGSKTEWVEVIHDRKNGKRDRYVYRGVNILASVDGKDISFDPAILLIQLTSALALLSVSNLIVENLMSKCLRLRGVYTSMKIKEMPDFSILNQTLDRMSKQTAAKLTYRDIKDMLEEIDSDYQRRRTSSVEEIKLAKKKAMQRFKSAPNDYVPPHLLNKNKNKKDDDGDNGKSSSARNKNSWSNISPTTSGGGGSSNRNKNNNNSSTTIDVKNNNNTRISDVELTKKIIDNS